MKKRRCDNDEEEEEPLNCAASLLSCWWRRRKCCQGKHQKTSEVRPPQVILNNLLKRDDCKEFLRGQLEVFKHDSPPELYTKSTIFYALEEYSKASDTIDKCVKLLGTETKQGLQESLKYSQSLNESTRQILWFDSMVKVQVKAISKVSNGMGHYDAVDVVEASKLTVKEFQDQYSSKRKPVVLTGLNLTEDEWTLNHIKAVAGKKTVTLKTARQDSTEWARLEPVESASISAFVDKIKAKEAEGRYLFDWSLPLFCPHLLKGLKVPDYFQQDYLKLTSEDALYRNSWPSLFVSPSGNVSELHVDAFGSHFWMALFEGRKRWTFFHPDQLNLLKPRYYDSLDPVFDVDLSGKDVQLANKTDSVVVLEPGQVLFVPAGSPHRVENLDDTVAVSGNFVDKTNIDSAVEFLLRDSLVDPRAADLLQELIDRKLAV